MRLANWCPNGCGKCVVRDWNLQKYSLKPYHCPRCKKHFSLKELKDIN